MCNFSSTLRSKVFDCSENVGERIRTSPLHQPRSQGPSSRSRGAGRGEGRCGKKRDPVNEVALTFPEI